MVKAKGSTKTNCPLSRLGLTFQLKSYHSMCVIPSIYILTISMTWNLNEWRNTCWSLIKTSAMYFQPCPARHLQSNFQKTLVCLSPLRIAERGSQSLKPAKCTKMHQNAPKCINMPHMDTYWWFNYGSKSKTWKATGLSLCLHSIHHPISSNYWGYPTLENIHFWVPKIPPASLSICCMYLHVSSFRFNV